jgi:FtsX-like permease family protein
MPDSGRIINEAEMNKIGKQIKLPWSKAIEIAAKSMKIRFGRSLVTTASIVLAIAFLMSILTSTSVVTSLKTAPVRKVVQLRERVENAKQLTDAAEAEKLGLVFPADASADQARKKVKDLEAAVTTSAGDEKLIAGVNLSVAEAERDVLTAKNDSEKTAALKKWRVAQATADYRLERLKWSLLVRQLKDEGHDIEDKVDELTAVPAKPSYTEIVTTYMAPRDKWLALLASLVCFVGIMNAMLMSVHERFREIGTMKCLGALESFIVKLYFLESAFIGMVGTLLGIATGFLLSMVRAMIAFGPAVVFENFDLTGALLSALGTLLIGSLLSVGAAIFPAMSAAKMDPIEAMRVDE